MIVGWAQAVSQTPSPGGPDRSEAGVALEARAALVKLRSEKPSEQLLIFS